jgi:hypothetical protein
MWGPFATSGDLETLYRGLERHSVTPSYWWWDTLVAGPLKKVHVRLDAPFRTLSDVR